MIGNGNLVRVITPKVQLTTPEHAVYVTNSTVWDLE